MEFRFLISINRQDLLIKAVNCNTNKQTIRNYTPEGNLSSEHFENGLKIRHRYDRTNRLIECIYPDKSSVRQTYNPVFLEKAERIKEDKVIYTTIFSEFGQSGKPQNITFPKESGNLTLEYDLLNRPISLSYPHYQEEEISYDNRGQLISKRVNNELQTFDHDPLQQLTLEKTALYSHTYENDALHRQTSVDGCTQIHNAVHQLTHGSDDAYEYDAKGRRRQDSTTNYTYDRFDRLIDVEQGESNWSYTYDAFNRKMSRTASGKTTYYLYDGHEDIGSYSSEQKCIDLKILSAAEGSIPIAIELESQHYAPHLSSQGHIVGLVEIETGDLADQSFLTLFGKDLSENPLSPWRFCGKRHEDAALGIIDFGYRFYHPKTAQWLTQDPLGESDGPNLYAYVKNNPACYVDRFGLFGDGFSFSGAWDSFKETCNDCWNTVTDYCSGSQDIASDFGSTNWDTTIDQCNQAGTLAPNDTEGSPSFLSEQGLGIGSFALDLTPFVGIVKSAGELVVGEDLVTGEESSRVMSAIGLIPFGKVVAKLGMGLSKAAKVGIKFFRSIKSRRLVSFTENNFRKNLKRYTGISPGKQLHAHHVFPKEHAAEFAKRGINVHDPKHGIWWEATEHWGAHGNSKYNDYWDKVLRENPTLKTEELYEMGRNMMDRFGKKVNF